MTSSHPAVVLGRFSVLTTEQLKRGPPLYLTHAFCQTLFQFVAVPTKPYPDTRILGVLRCLHETDADNQIARRDAPRDHQTVRGPRPESKRPA